MIKELRSSDPISGSYFAHGAVHAPLQAKIEDIEKYKGKYDAGWDEFRKQRFERQQELGVVPDKAILPDRILNKTMR